MTEELKRCSLCGNRIAGRRSFRYRKYITVKCDECGAEGPPSETEKGAAKGRNARHGAAKGRNTRNGEQQAAGEL